jgi:hypothetical protein
VMVQLSTARRACPSPAATIRNNSRRALWAGDAPGPDGAGRPAGGISAT